MSKRAPTAYNLFVRAQTPRMKEDMGGNYTPTESMKLIAALWRREKGLSSPAKNRSPKSRKSAGCNEDWADKCAALNKVCHVGESGRRSCTMRPEDKKAAAKASAKKSRATKNALSPNSPKTRGRPRKTALNFF